MHAGAALQGLQVYLLIFCNLFFGSVSISVHTLKPPRLTASLKKWRLKFRTLIQQNTMCLRVSRYALTFRFAKR